MLKEEAQRTIEWRARAELDADVAIVCKPQTDKTDGHGAYIGRHILILFFF